jgi:serine phosphatase RsbU (regulator of sigma subunit)
MWGEVNQLNASFSELIANLRNDLQLAERIQKGRFPARFAEIKGFEVTTRYLAGMKSGGDHFDLAESQDAQRLSMVLSDSSSYGLSSAVLSVLMKVALKLSSEEASSASETVRRIRDELVLTLKEKERLSMFYGVLSRKDYVLKYLNLGSTAGFYAPQSAPFKQLPSQGEAISLAGKSTAFNDGQITLEPGGRLVLLSDGFIETVGSLDAACGLLNRFQKSEGKDLANELLFGVKSRFKEPDDMPEQDCTLAVFDMDARVIRLAR